MTLRSEMDGCAWQPNPESVAPNDQARFIAALFSGGDSRIAVDPGTGLNKYLCPEVPAPSLTCVSSCTASPISAQSFEGAAAAFFDVDCAPSPHQRAQRITVLIEQIKARLLRYFGVGALAQVILCPSGTDAMQTAAMLIASGSPGKTMTAILPSASETGTGVPMAVMCRVFDGPDTGKPLTDYPGNTVEISLRSADGSPRPEDEVNDAFAAARAATPGNVVVYLTHGTKTGLIAPVSPPRDADVIVDACQARIEPEAVAAYLNQGWPVVITGSKFFGGPAFSGAVLFPRARLPAIARRKLPAISSDAASLGTALRWTAAITAIDAFEALAASMPNVLTSAVAVVEHALALNPTLVPIGGLQPYGSGWAGRPSIFTFGVRDPTDHRRLLSAAELRPVYERLGHMGILLGQPVGLGHFGGLRIAIGARDLLDGPGFSALPRVFAALDEVTAQSCCVRGVR